jgi:hypothetical protein
MSGISGAGAGTRSAKINAALSEAGVKDTNNLAAEVKVYLRADVNAQSALDNLSQASASFGGGGGVASSPGTFSSASPTMGAWDAKFAEAASLGAHLDSMESEAMSLMKSPKKEDQIKGQMMMQAVNQIMEAIIKAIAARGDSAKSAIQNSVAR